MCRWNTSENSRKLTLISSITFPLDMRERDGPRMVASKGGPQRRVKRWIEVFIGARQLKNNPRGGVKGFNRERVAVEKTGERLQRFRATQLCLFHRHCVQLTWRETLLVETADIPSS